VPADARIPVQAGLGNVSYADSNMVEASFTRPVPVAAPVARTRAGEPAAGKTGTTAANRSVAAEPVNAERADDTVVIPQDESSMQAAALARSGMSPIQRRSSTHTETRTTRAPAEDETVSEETPDTDRRTRQDHEITQNRSVSGDTEPASAPDGGTPEPSDNSPRRNTGMPFCMPGTRSRRDDEEDEFHEI
jgi:hypothetical protein